MQILLYVIENKCNTSVVNVGGFCNLIHVAFLVNTCKLVCRSSYNLNVTWHLRFAVCRIQTVNAR